MATRQRACVRARVAAQVRAPSGLDELQDGTSDENEDEEAQQQRTNAVGGLRLAALGHPSTLVDVLVVLLSLVACACACEEPRRGVASR